MRRNDFLRGACAAGLSLVVSPVVDIGRARGATGVKNTFYYFVFSNPVAGEEAVYNDWYTHRHQFDVVSVPGFKTAQRFVATDIQLRNGTKPKQKYLMLFTIVTDDLPAVRAEVRRRLQTGETYVSPSFDRTTAAGGIYKRDGAEVLHSGAQNATGDVYIHIVFNNANIGQDRAFVRWYKNRQLRDIVAIPGFTHGDFGILDERSNRRKDNRKYMALFQIKAPDLSETAAAFHKAEPTMTISPALDRSSKEALTYKAMEPIIYGDDVRKARTQAKEDHAVSQPAEGVR